MAYCGPRGLPLSVFLGRVVAPGEPEWLPEDRDAALEWSAHEAQRCNGCGTHHADWREDRTAFHAHLGRPCPGCQNRARREKALKEGELEPGQAVVLAPGSAAACPSCNPHD